MLVSKNNHKDMTMIIVILLIVVLFNLLVHAWGVDSTDGIDSADWERRHTWRNSTTRINTAHKRQPRIMSKLHLCQSIRQMVAHV